MTTTPPEDPPAIGQPPPAAPEDSRGLPRGSVGVSAESTTFPEGMDWSAVALLLAEKAELPVVLLSEEGELLHVAPAAQKVLGCRGDLIGKNWIELQASDRAAFHARWIISKALAGATHLFDVNVPAAQGTSVVTFESYPIGHGVGRGILLFVQNVVPATGNITVRDFDYEVEKVSSGSLRLRSLQRWGHLPIAADGECFRVLHDRSSVCERCPVAALTTLGDVRTFARRCSDGEIEVSTARLVKNGHAAVSVRRLSNTISRPCCAPASTSWPSARGCRNASVTSWSCWSTVRASRESEPRSASRRERSSITKADYCPSSAPIREAT